MRMDQQDHVICYSIHGWWHESEYFDACPGDEESNKTAFLLLKILRDAGCKYPAVFIDGKRY